MSHQCVQDFATKCKNFFDQCNGGEPITIGQLHATLLKVNSNFKMSDKEFAETFMEIDTDGSRTISWDEFSSALLKKSPKEVTRCELESLFKEKDTDGSGKLNKKEIKEMCNCLGIKGQDETIDRILNDSDKNGDGEVDFQEFLAAYKSA